MANPNDDLVNATLDLVLASLNYQSSVMAHLGEKLVPYVTEEEMLASGAALQEAITRAMKAALVQREHG